MKRLLLLTALMSMAASVSRADEAAVPATASQPSQSSVAVMDTVAQGASEAAARTVTEVMAAYASDVLKLEVSTNKDFQDRISFEQARQLTGCETGSCDGASNVGNMLGVAKLVTSSLGQLGSRLTLTVGAMDVRTSTVLFRSSRDVKSEAELTENARDLIHYVLTGQPRESMGYARIESTESGALVTIDGEMRGVTPLATPIRLLAGRHQIIVSKNGFIPIEGAVEIEVGKETLFEAKLLAKSDVKVAGLSFVPWAGAAAGVAAVLGGMSGYFYYDANRIYQDTYLKDSITKSELDKARDDIDFRGNTLHYYSAWGAGIMAGVSVALFSAYFISGVGAGGDAPADASLPIEPTGDGFAIRF